MTFDQLSNSTIFPLGEKMEANFIGDNASIGNVTFAPGPAITGTLIRLGKCY